MEKRDILVIFGPTASGKSKLATQIASKHKSAIINFDSLQVYKDLKILTDRPDDEICKKFDHRLYGMLKGNESCSAAIWLEKAEHEINNCFDNKLLPIVVGGTGLYLKALMDGLSEIPSIKISGRKTATKISVVAIIANEICLEPLYAATNGVSPFSILE